MRHFIIRTHDEVHTAFFSGPGGGKTAGFLIPSLLTDPRNAVVLDAQGVIYSNTARHRAERWGHEIVRIDTSGICGPGGGGLNPFDYLLATSPTLYNDCRNLANQLVTRKGTEHDPHWTNRAEDVLTCMSYFVARYMDVPERRNLLAVKQALASPDHFMASCNVLKSLPGLAAELGQSMDWLKDKELNSVQSVVSSHTGWMNSPVVADSLRSTTFDINTLKTGRMTVYIVEHPANLETNAAHLRMILGTILGVTTRGKASESSPIRYVIDEAAALGRMKILENATTQLRAFGVRLVLAYQSTAQLRQCYGDNAQTMLDSIGTQVYFGIKSYETLEHISKLIGDSTVAVQSHNRSVSWSYQNQTGPAGGESSRSESSSTDTREQGRRLFKEEEIRTMPADMALVFHSNMPIIPVKIERHFDSPLFLDGGPSRGGLGKAAGIVAAFLLLASLLLSAFVATLPPPARRLPPAIATEGDPPVFRPSPAPPQRPGLRPPQPGRNRNSRLPSRSGYLIPIR